MSTGSPLSYSPTEAAKVIGISKAKFYQLLAEGQISARKSDRRTLILRSELERFVNSLPEAEYGSPQGVER